MSGYPSYPPLVNMYDGNSSYQNQNPYPVQQTGPGGMPQPVGGFSMPQQEGGGGYPSQPYSGYPSEAVGYPGSLSFGGYPNSAPAPINGYDGSASMTGGIQYGFSGAQPSPQSTFPNTVPSSYYPGTAQAGYPGAVQSGYPFSGPVQSAYPGAPPDNKPKTIITGQSSVTTNNQGTQAFQLTVACKKLLDKDFFSKSDPVCVMYTMQANGTWLEVGRTEKIINNLNPNWQTTFLVEQKAGQQPVKLKFEVYDWDCKSNNLKKHDFLARAEVDLETIINSPGQQCVVMNSTGKSGQFVIVAERVTSDKNVVKIQLGARNLDNKDTFSKSDPFYIITKPNGQGRPVVVYKSNVVMNKLNPVWAPLSMSVRKLCNGDYNASLKIEVYDFDDNGKHDLIGDCSVTLKQLAEAMGQNKSFIVINPNKRNKRNYRNSGELFVKDFAIWEAPSFVDPH